MNNKDKAGKARLHERNKNRDLYNLEEMVNANPALQDHIILSKKGTESINFSDPTAVKVLNRTILKHYYKIDFWEFPNENLCPPIPGRADYIHHIADLLAESNNGVIPTKNKVTCLDVGTGASCIYPIIGVTEYGWNFIGTEIEARSIEAAEKIVNMNPTLMGNIVIKKQNNPNFIFKGIINKGDKIDVTICNPPFHASLEEATKGTKRKVRNLGGKNSAKPTLNFSGNKNELIYKGGEYKFVSNMIVESEKLGKNCLWFSSLVSKESNLKKLIRKLKDNSSKEIKVIDTSTGNKKSRVLVWNYLSPDEKKKWAKERWK